MIIRKRAIHIVSLLVIVYYKMALTMYVHNKLQIDN